MLPLPLVFVPGFKGSTLVGPDGRAAWLDLLTAAGLRTPALALPLDWEKRLGADQLTPGEPIHSVTIVPHLLRSPIYGRWLDAARSWRRPFHGFAYDWRQDNGASAADFEAYLEAIVFDDLRSAPGFAQGVASGVNLPATRPRRRSASIGSPAQVVAHSMGGLIALWVLNRRPELFRSLILAGSPVGGGIGLLEDMHAGIPTGLNRQVVGPRVAASFPSAYSFFPEDGYGLVDQDGAPLPTDFFDARAWVARRLGLLWSDPASPALLAWLQGTLDRARAFRAGLCARAQRYPPITLIAADHLPTLETAQRDGPRSVRGWDFVSRPRVPGDGRVRYSATALPEGIPFQVVRVRKPHSAILDEVSVVKQVLEQQAG